MDEPVSGVDMRGKDLFYKLVFNLRNLYDLSIILVSHDLNMVARYADRVVLLNKTVICTGTPDEVLNSENLQQAFGPAYPANNLNNRVQANIAGGVFI